MTMSWETVAIPVSKGIDVTQEARLVEPPSLLEAVNSRFGRGGGSAKRRGHTGYKVRGLQKIPSGVTPANYNYNQIGLFDTYDTSPRDIPSDWLWGWGRILNSVSNTRTSTESINQAAGVSSWPSADLLFGGTSRDKEDLAWNGHELYSFSSSQQSIMNELRATLPVLRVSPMAKTQLGQNYPDGCDNGFIRLVAWMTSAPKVNYAIYDSATSANLVVGKALDAVTPYQIRCIPMGNYVHILVADSDSGGSLILYTINKDDVNTVVKRSLGACTNFFDIWKIDENTAIIMVGKSAAQPVTLFIRDNGTAHPQFSGWTASFGDGGGTHTAYNDVAISVHPVSRNVCTCIYTTHASEAKLYTKLWSITGTALIVTTTVASGMTGDCRVTCAPKYLFDSSGNDVFDIYWDEQGFGVSGKLSNKRVTQAGLSGFGSIVWHQWIGGQAFRVGDRTYVLTGHGSTLQSTWFILDESLAPVGHLDFIVANPYGPNISDHIYKPSMNWRFTGPAKDRLVFHTVRGYRQRVPATSTNTGLFTEPSIKFVEIDFLPRLRAAQAGRSVYFAGAQVWAYDGVELTEAGFHICPELIPGDITDSVGGNLTAGGNYSYRIDLCYRNSQNEEIRSASLLTATHTLPGGGGGVNKTITLSIPTCITRRSNSYFLVYRNVNNGTAWFLVNSRDPSSTNFLTNGQNQSAITFVDDGTNTPTDAQLISNEIHPANVGDSYLQPFASPACEIIASGRDRLWVAGGELINGQILPSRLFDPGDVPSFNSYLQVQVDRGNQPITAIGFVGEIAAIFRKNNSYILDSDGPNNISVGVWASPRLAQSDIGAISQESLGLISAGLIFQSPAGFRVLNPGGGVQPIGQPTDQIARDFGVLGTLVADADQEIRFYGPLGVIVYNYLYDCWSTWTCGAWGVSRDYDTGRAVLYRANGELWIEDSDDSIYLDNGAAYQHRVRFPWLHAGNLGDFQRVKLISALGRFDEGDTHFVHVELYYDERPFFEETFDWTMPDPISSNTDTFGLRGFGEGVFGDIFGGAQNTDGYKDNGEQSSTDRLVPMNDSSWDWTRGPQRQKCSVISVAISDNYSPNKGFVLTALCLELGKKRGLNKTPARSPGSNFRQ